MISIIKDWNPKQKKLNELLSDSKSFLDGISLCCELHYQVHDILAQEKELTIYQKLINDLPAEAITFRPKNHFSSIAWNIWHITRIEDAVSNILINDSKQIIFNRINKLNTKTIDTGNAFSERDIDEFNSSINVKELLKYRKAVGENTQGILATLTNEDRKTRPTQDQLNRILSEGVLTKEKDSIWLLDFWGKKTISGLLTMPLTRHQIMHISDCFKIRERYEKYA